MQRRWAPLTARVEAVCVGRPVLRPDGRRIVETAIDKQAVTGPVAVTRLGCAGDAQADRVHHGGPDQAVYAYADEDADHWATALRREVPPGSLGENLRLRGVAVSQARIGERWRLGSDLLVEVTAPRIPCRTFAAFWDVPDLVGRFLSAGRPGAYLRVLEEGRVQAGDGVRVEHRPDHDVTVAEVLRIHTADRAEVDRLLGLPGLAERLVEWARRRPAPA